MFINFNFYMYEQLFIRLFGSPNSMPHVIPSTAILFYAILYYSLILFPLCKLT